MNWVRNSMMNRRNMLIEVAIRKITPDLMLRDEARGVAGIGIRKELVGRESLRDGLLDAPPMRSDMCKRYWVIRPVRDLGGRDIRQGLGRKRPNGGLLVASPSSGWRSDIVLLWLNSILSFALRNFVESGSELLRIRVPVGDNEWKDTAGSLQSRFVKSAKAQEGSPDNLSSYLERNRLGQCSATLRSGTAEENLEFYWIGSLQLYERPQQVLESFALSTLISLLVGRRRVASVLLTSRRRRGIGALHHCRRWS
jgi:hypothetical protein